MTSAVPGVPRPDKGHCSGAVCHQGPVPGPRRLPGTQGPVGTLWGQAGARGGAGSGAERGGCGLGVSGWVCCRAGGRARLPVHTWHLPALCLCPARRLCPAACGGGQKPLGAWSPWLRPLGAAAGAGVPGQGQHRCGTGILPQPAGAAARGTQGRPCPVPPLPLPGQPCTLLAILLCWRGHSCTVQALQVSNLLIYNSKACPYINEPLMSC